MREIWSPYLTALSFLLSKDIGFVGFHTPNPIQCPGNQIKYIGFTASIDLIVFEDILVVQIEFLNPPNRVLCYERMGINILALKEALQ